MHLYNAMATFHLNIVFNVVLGDSGDANVDSIRFDSLLLRQ